MPAKLIDITGYRYGKLLVTKRVEDYISPKGVKYSQWLCQCDCGNKTIARKTHLTDGTKTSCGCEARRLTSERSMKDLTGQRFHMLIAKERISMTDKNGKKISKWRCVCDCGNETIARTTDLLSGQTKSCGCLRVTAVSKAHFEDLTGIEFGYLTPKERVEDYITRGGFAYTQWVCQCRCGNYKVVPANRLKRGTTHSCGCKKMSTGESVIDDILFERHIDNIYNYTFNDLIGPGGGPLMFDFAIIRDKKLCCLIEYQGEQHYTDTEFGKQQREITDSMKKEYCKTNNIPLFEIRYNENIEEAINTILNKIYVDTVPSSIYVEKV